MDDPHDPMRGAYNEGMDKPRHRRTNPPGITVWEVAVAIAIVFALLGLAVGAAFGQDAATCLPRRVMEQALRADPHGEVMIWRSWNGRAAVELTILTIGPDKMACIASSGSMADAVAADVPGIDG